MKRVLASLLLVFFTLVSFQQLSLVGIYVLNQDFITENFCINKDKPEMQCKGKCHLKDTIAKTNSEKEDLPIGIELQIQFPVFISEGAIYAAFINWEKSICLDKPEAVTSAYVSSHFRPPPVV